ncbi:unnamed protein product [Rhizoctonia solani]|uniref:Extracellular membrane protein CFEM domain-containing protein n=3 Tax=Rhizoctonia solani TaxID=456999 RepID=A0A8H3HJR3_9AGAM|nr:hypothetical protein RSOL_432470 [Rhizoctonia solani AG-3 Rhs1AP]KEP51616.1 hypothetical protein V565_058510 [Rhizoctonia solani 123E]CAE6489945.1 unnamed protein product [Rhizoctonia solani]CAE6515934.1 unnamed protein product [Rhizoctonia solani]
MHYSLQMLKCKPLKASKLRREGQTVHSRLSHSYFTMQFIAIALLAAASLTNGQSVPANAPGCVKYCLRIAREQTPSACTWAGWCGTSGFQDAVSNCYTNICGPANQQVGAQIYQQICSQAGSDTTCPASSASASVAPISSIISSVSESASSVISSVVSEASTAVSSASDVVTTIAGVATTIPASVTSSVAAELTSSAAAASSSSESAALSLTSAVSTATAPVSSAISSLLSSAASVVSSATSGAIATQSPNAASALGLPSGQLASLGAIFVGVAAGALML